MPLHYHVYGLGIDSDVVIDGLSPVARRPSPAIRLHTGAITPLPQKVDSSWLDDDPVDITRDDHAVVLVYRDGTRFRVERDVITTSWTTTAEDMATYLLGPVLAFALRMRGMLVLHASAVAIDGRAILFAGAAGAGKSTTAAAFVQQGATMITDDVAAIDDHRVHPGYARLRLWDDSAAALFGSPDALPHLTPTWPKRYASAPIADEPTPLRAIVILNGRADETAIRPLQGHEAVMAVLARTSVPQLIEDEHRATELAQVVDLVAAVPVVEVMLKNDFDPARELFDRLP